MEELTRLLGASPGLTQLVGEAPAFLEAISDVPRIAEADAPTLLVGETGTGKELLARAIHYFSKRRGFPFVPVNCGSFPDTLLEDELFGHERGAFTDAHAHRRGLVAQADHGTLFLDELDTLSPRGQVSLLRVVQDNTFRPIGASAERQVDIRLIAATNAPLEAMVGIGQFRADLYYRLTVFTILVPPLRERKEDISALAAHFIRKHTPAGKSEPWLSAEALALLNGHDWPGNVRELENAIIRGVYLCRGTIIESRDLGLGVPRRPATSAWTAGRPERRASFRDMKREVIETFEKDYLTSLMREHRGNVSQAALAAGKERRDFGKLLKKHSIHPRQFQAAG